MKEFNFEGDQSQSSKEKYGEWKTPDILKELEEKQKELKDAKDETEKQFLRDEDKQEAEARYQKLKKDLKEIEEEMGRRTHQN